MKYASVDIETTGLDWNRHQIIEFAAVLDDLADPKPLKELPVFHAYVRHEEVVGHPVALAMNHEILKIIAQGDCGYADAELMDAFADFLKQHGRCPLKIVVAGKNFNGFDRNFLNALPRTDRPVTFHHRTLDPAPLYAKIGDPEPPSLVECLKRANLTPTYEHRAVGDALDVIRLLRQAYLSKENWWQSSIDPLLVV